MTRTLLAVAQGAFGGLLLIAMFGLGLTPMPYWIPIFLLIGVGGVGFCSEVRWRRYGPSFRAGCLEGLLMLAVSLTIVVVAGYVSGVMSPL